VRSRIRTDFSSTSSASTRRRASRPIASAPMARAPTANAPTATVPKAAAIPAAAETPDRWRLEILRMSPSSGTKPRLPATALENPLRLLALLQLVFDELVGDVVLVDVADIRHGLGSDLLLGDVLHVVEPHVGVEAPPGGFAAELRDTSRPRVVCRESEERLVE